MEITNSTLDINALNEKIERESAFVDILSMEMNKVIVGQKHMVERLMIGLLGQGHILLEGVPGLAKTLAINTLSQAVHGQFSRIQFTPDLLPADVVGTMIYNMKLNDFSIKKGPIFANFVLADEINRAPAKVQSALLEAMEEKQVTIDDLTYHLNQPFLVIATQNPLEQQGTYPLPEAQQDRFMFKLKIDYPSREEEGLIMERFNYHERVNFRELDKILSEKEIFRLRDSIASIYIDDNIKNYILDIVFKTRESSPYIECGASPRASINLIKAARGKAFLEGRNYVSPDDVKSIVYDVLRHRIILSYE